MGALCYSHDGFEGNFRRLLDWVGIHPCGDGEESHATYAMLQGKLQRVVVATGQQFCLAVTATVPDGSNRMVDVLPPPSGVGSTSSKPTLDKDLRSFSKKIKKKQGKQEKIPRNRLKFCYI